MPAEAHCISILILYLIFSNSLSGMPFLQKPRWEILAKILQDDKLLESDQFILTGFQKDTFDFVRIFSDSCPKLITFHLAWTKNSDLLGVHLDFY
jgi:hypothetical protein